MIDNVKKGNWFDRLKEFINGTLLGPILKSSYKQEIPTLTEENDENKKNEWDLNGTLDLEEKYSTRDKTPLSFNTLQTIALFKNGTKISETPQNGGNFENEGPLLDKLTRYQVFINFLIEHKDGDKLPNLQYIVDNCVYKNEKIFTERIIKKHKSEGAVIGDFTQDEETGRYTLVRTEKY